jgi:hypothetical protein
MVFLLLTALDAGLVADPADRCDDLIAVTAGLVAALCPRFATRIPQQVKVLLT